MNAIQEYQSFIFNTCDSATEKGEESYPYEKNPGVGCIGRQEILSQKLPLSAVHVLSYVPPSP